jgi:hypothetical protein
LKQISAILLGAIMLLAVIPSYDSFAEKPVDPGAISIEKIKESKVVEMKDGRIMEKVVHVFYEDEQRNAKPDGKGKPQKDRGGDTCYSVISKGTIWKTPETYIVDEDNSGLLTGVALTDIQTSINSWESEITSNQKVFLTGNTGQADMSIIGTDWNNINEVAFGTLDNPNVIAVTISWGYFSGPPPLREMVEWDMVFNTSFNWGDAGDTNEDELGNVGVMDYVNIATHEIGHATGLDHSGDTCTNESMYAYAQNGETKKRTLSTGDIAGINSIY